MNILITGAASGIGRATAELYDREGHSVFAIDIQKISGTENIISYNADVTCEANIMRVIGEIHDTGVTLDAIVCVAGIHTMASLVEEDYAKIKRVVDVNLLGAMLVCRAAHPLLSERGRIVIVTSEVASYSPLPFNGLYNLTKVALDSYAEALRQELNLLGQRVITVRPGAVKTPLEASSMASTEALAEKTTLYKKQAKHFTHFVEKFTGKPTKPEKIASLIYSVTSKKHPRSAYSINRHIGLLLLSLLPHSLQCKIIKALLDR
ncbi:MAG: SDR family NAD(P)-dependent oxidoreductase [Clostridia bacterium]|nr:SDR family NAD(P)-dependent oxidoreductase [Clostridia bacterium]